MILARKACGITNQSSIIEQYQSGNGYVIKTQGTKGSVLVLAGTPNCDTQGYKLISSGDNYAFYVSNNISVDGLRPGTDNPYPGEIPDCVKPIEGHVYCYFQANKDYTSPNIWVWNDSKNFCTNQNWPGDKLTKVGSDSDGHEIYLWDGGAATANMPTGVLFSTGSGSPQTADFVFHNGGYYDAAGYLTTPTGVNNIYTNPTATDAPAYTLTGQRAAGNYHGIVIKNGRKYMQK